MKFEICTHTTHLLKTVVALPWTRNLLATSQLRPCTKLVEWLQESTSKSSSNWVGSTGNVGWRFTCEASVSLTQWTPRESTTAFAQILDAKFSGNKRPGTGPTPKENASAYQHQNNHPNFITVLWIPSCATFSWIHRLSLYTMPEKLTIKSFSCPCLSIIDDATAVPASQPHTHHQEHDKTDGCNARYGRDRAHQNILIMKAISSEQLICWNSWNS
jgi:hypothetical protein